MHRQIIFSCRKVAEFETAIGLCRSDAALSQVHGLGSPSLALLQPTRGGLGGRPPARPAGHLRPRAPPLQALLPKGGFAAGCRRLSRDSALGVGGHAPRELCCSCRLPAACQAGPIISSSTGEGALGVAGRLITFCPTRAPGVLGLFRAPWSSGAIAIGVPPAALPPSVRARAGSLELDSPPSPALSPVAAAWEGSARVAAALARARALSAHARA